MASSFPVGCGREVPAGKCITLGGEARGSPAALLGALGESERHRYHVDPEHELIEYTLIDGILFIVKDTV